jgi:hypothetical protein
MPRGGDGTRRGALSVCWTIRRLRDIDARLAYRWYALVGAGCIRPYPFICNRTINRFRWHAVIRTRDTELRHRNRIRFRHHAVIRTRPFTRHRTRSRFRHSMVICICSVIPPRSVSPNDALGGMPANEPLDSIPWYRVYHSPVSERQPAPVAPEGEWSRKPSVAVGTCGASYPGSDRTAAATRTLSGR